MRRIILAILLLIGSNICFATDILISDVPETEAFQIDCESSSSEATTTTYFFDDGGNNYYYSNVSYIRDIQSTNGSIISVKFVNFNLANGTLLTIKDAVTREVLVANATGTSLNGQTITSHHGKLRFIWTAGAIRGQGFKAKVWCGSPCQQFTTNITVDIEPTSTETGLYYDVCQNAPVTFTANNVFLNNNQEYNQSDDNLTYNWLIFSQNDTSRFNDAGRTFSHSFTESGGYYVLCDAIDSRGCANHEVNSVRVRVSIAPTWENVHFSPDTICSGTEVTFTGSPHVEPWRDETPNVVGGATFLPDGNGQCYNTSVNFDSFDEGAIINSASDIDRIYINIEHSFLGDLAIMLECPNGQQCLLKAFNRGNSYQDGPIVSNLNWQNTGGTYNIGSQRGGGAHLGLAHDNGSCNDDPGYGFPYYFYPDGDEPFGEYSNYRPTIVSVNRGDYADSLLCPEQVYYNCLAYGEEHRYGPYENMTSLIGCPLNGEWRLYVCDMWAIDNGWIFEWGIYFNEEVFPADLWEFENTYSEDGFFWEWGTDRPHYPWMTYESTGPTNNGNIPSGSEMYSTVVTKAGTQRDNDENPSLTIVDRPQNTDPDNPALIPYTFSVTDNFGCTYDTTVTVYVLPAGDPSCCITPVPEISVSDTMPCTNSVTLTASDFDLLGNTGEWTYRGPGTATFGDINQPQTEVSVNVYGDYTFTWHEYYLGNLGCSGEASINVNFAQQMDATLSSVDNCCHSASPIVLNAPDFGTLTCSPYTPAFNADARTFTPNLALPDEYTITNTIANQRCASPAESSVTFQIYDEITVSNRTEICTSSENGTVEIRFNVNGLSESDVPPTYSITGSYSSNGSATINVEETDRNLPQYILSAQGPIEYSLLVSDEHGCSNVNVQGNYECDCPNYAGTFVDYNAKIMCTGEAYWLQRGHTENHGHNGNQVDTARNAVFSYIICTNPNDIQNTFVTELPGSTEAIYLSTISGQNNQQYYLVAVVGFGSGLNAWGNGCRSVSQPVPLMWKASPIVTAIDADTCGFVIQLKGSEPANDMHGYWTATPPDGVTNYTFTTIEGTTNTDYNAKVLSSHYGQITYTWHIVNAECTDSASAIYNFRRIPSPNAGPDITVCGVSAEITGANPTSPAIDGSTLQWSGHGVVINNASTTHPTVNANGSGTYSILLIERNGECAGSDYTNITFINIPSPATTANVDTVCGHVGELQVYNANPANEGRWTAYDTNGNVLPVVSYSDYNNSTGINSDRYTHCFVTVPIPDDVSEVEYVFRWTERITDPRIPEDAGCMGEAEKHLVFRKMPAISVHQCNSTGNSVTVCGNSVELCAETSASDGFSDYIWMCKQVAGTFADSSQTSTTFTLDPSIQIARFMDADIYFIGRNSSCTSIDTMHVRFLQKPVANAGLDHVACGNSYTLNGVWGLPPANNYTPVCQWTVGEKPNPQAQVTWENNSQNNIYGTVQVSDNGIYTFIVREINTAGDAETCFDRDTVTIEFMEVPNVRAGDDFNVCGLDFQLNAISSHVDGDSITGSWISMNGGAATFTDRTDPHTTGHYSAYGEATFLWTETNHPHIQTENEETCSASDEVVVTFYEVPSAVISMNEGDTVTCSLTASFLLRAEDPGDGISGYWYEVSPMTMFGPNNQTYNQPVTTVKVPTYGPHDFYWIEYTGPDGDPRFCKDTAGPWTITFLEEPVADITRDSITFCGYDGQLTVNFNGVGEGLWATNASSSNLIFDDRTDPNTIVHASILGENPFGLYYEVYWMVQNTEYCTDVDTIMVAFAMPPSDSIKVIPPKCFGEPAILTAYEDTLAVYDWDFGNGYIDSIQTNVAAGEYRAFVHWENRETSHTVGLTATNSWGCQSSIGIAIVEEPILPEYNYRIISDTCALGKGGIEFLDTTGLFAFFWIDTTGTTISDPNTDYAITNLHVYDLPAGFYKYHAYYQTFNTENISIYRQYFGDEYCRDIVEFEVGTIGMIDAAIAVSADVALSELTAPNAEVIFVNSTNYDNVSKKCEWHFGDESIENTCDELVQHTYTEPGCYEPYLVVMNRDISECRDTAFLDECVFVDKKSKLEVPNIFSPNGDDINDYFQVKAESLKSFNGIIMNRNGNIVFEWSDWKSEDAGWDGRINGSTKATPGVYFYIIEAEGQDGTPYSEEGSLNLVR